MFCVPEIQTYLCRDHKALGIRVEGFRLSLLFDPRELRFHILRRIANSHQSAQKVGFVNDACVFG